METLSELRKRVLARLRRRVDRAPRIHVPLHLHSDAEGGLRPPPIFIIGCQRSGTSLLRRILDSHSGIACPPESKFLLPLTEILRSDAALRGLASMGYSREEVAKALSASASAFFEGYATAQGKRRWADKTPNYIDCLGELWEMFGTGTRFVVLIRNGLDVAYSLANPRRSYPAIEELVREEKGNVPVAAGRFWALQNEKIERFRTAHPSSCVQIRYEELTATPEPVLRSVFEFVGEPWESAVLQYNSLRHHSGFEDHEVVRKSRIRANSGRYRSWPEQIVEDVTSACQPTLRFLGY
jgi:Sulfotransferase family